MPFTLRNLEADLDDVGPNFGAASDLEFRVATQALCAISVSRPAVAFRSGTRTGREKEVYVVVRGSGRMKVDDAIVGLRELDAVRAPPGAWRGYEAGPEGLEILVVGAPNLGERQREDVAGQRDRWAGEGSSEALAGSPRVTGSASLAGTGFKSLVVGAKG